MANSYTREQLRKLYEKLPADLKEAIWSSEAAGHIFSISQNNSFSDAKMSDLALLTGNVLMGFLSPQDFPATLEKELKLEKDTARKIAQEINRLIFFPVKESLASLYKPVIEDLPQTKETPRPSSATVSDVTQATSVPKKPKQTKPDSYRETIE